MKTKKQLWVVSIILVTVAACLMTALGQRPSSTNQTSQSARPQSRASGLYEVRAFGAKGDGKAIDTPAINKAIEAAAAAGGGTVHIPAGTYLCFSIRLKSHIALYLDQGATIVAANPSEVKGGYDPPELNPWDKYQDFGHSHWHNSLIWGEGIEDVSILGAGVIWGKGLVRSGGQSRTNAQNDALRNVPTDRATAPFGYPNPRDAVDPGWGNKAIALKLCRNVVIRDVSILHGGHFAILATGVDNFTIDNLKIDTNRDGIDIDACRNVRVSNCSVNSPFDDGICPKSSYALGYARATENVTITNCQVSGYDEGTFLDGTYKREYNRYSQNSSTGRIKFGTESNGGFKNITISNCVFDYCRGLALESVDGGLLEDVTINNITMRDITNAPIFLRLGSRVRGPQETTTVGQLRRIIISNVVVYNASPKYGSIISGIPGHDIEDLKLSDIRIYYQGGGTKEQSALEPPEKENDYPEPNMFGEIPAYGFFIRHVKGIEMNNVEVSFMKEDLRPAFMLNDVKGADFQHVKAQGVSAVPIFALKNVENFSTHECRPVADTRLERVKQENLLMKAERPEFR